MQRLVSRRKLIFGAVEGMDVEHQVSQWEGSAELVRPGCTSYGAEGEEEGLLVNNCRAAEVMVGIDGVGPDSEYAEMGIG